MKNYNIGLDIGTTSIGWAVVEEGTQKIIKRGKGTERKALWGVRTFESANTAEERRMHRSARRRYDRRRERIKLLQEEFSAEMANIDSNFFKKLKNSKFYGNDLGNREAFTSDDDKKNIKKYYNEYKTIYHLRNRLITDDSKIDIRLVYLAIHHIIKYRGNFLFAFDSFNVESLDLSKKMIDVFNSLIYYFPALEIPDDYASLIDINEIANSFTINSKNDIMNKVKNSLCDITSNKKFSKEFAKLIVGDKFVIKDLFLLDTDNKLSISLNNNSYDENSDELSDLLGDGIETLDLLKQLYDIVFLKKMFKNSNSTSISALMIEKYNQHRDDLKYLKEKLRNNREKYNEFFRSKNDKICIYDRYVSNNIEYAELKNELLKIENIDKENKERIDNNDFLPRITCIENGKYPYQLNKYELIKIIENQGKYYPFLKNKINDEYKLVKLLKFRIPYYVGPLVSDEKSNFAWMERKIDNVKITAYNFDEVIDKEKTAEKFIKRMISHCTYLFDEYALPGNSILYSYYKVLNELKQIRINGFKLTNEVQHKVLNELFKKTNGSITDTKFKNYIRFLPDYKMYSNDINVTGYSSDGKFANNMQSYVDFFGEAGFFENTDYGIDDAEKIIEWITIFDDKDILEEKIRKEYNKLSDIQIKKIIAKKYKGWGNLSRKLLNTCYYTDKKTNIKKSILDLMYETDDNFMQILNNDEYSFQNMIKEINASEDSRKLSYKLVEDLATSPATKKGIYQALRVVDEIVKTMGSNPKNIMIEMARDDEIKQRKDDRKKYISKLYNNFKKEINNYNQLNKELEKFEKIDSTRLFLYFIQEGKCLYTGKSLNINDLNTYEVDHILPRTIIKDDSIDNKALVLKECNQIKKGDLVLPSEYRTSFNKKWWQHLKKIGLISAKKFDRLIRNEYSDEDILGFINRQLVETRQITKHVANILSGLYSESKIIYLKASLSHNYRDKYELFKFREINDYHHAHDAYLATVLGEYKEKYIQKSISYENIKELNSLLKESGKFDQLKYGYVINSLDADAYSIISKLTKNTINEDTGEVLFDIVEFNNTVANNLYRNDILVSRKVEIRSGKLFKESILPKNIGRIEIKKGMSVSKYGGYSSTETGYLTLVEHGEKKKLIGIPLEIVLKSKKDSQIKNSFIKEHLKTDFKILKDNIPFETLINYKGQDVYIKGYSVANMNCELSNATQLKIPKNKMKKWKYIFNKVLNKAKIDDSIISENSQISMMKDIIEYLYSECGKYPLFKNYILIIKEKIKLDDLSIEELSDLIVELLKIYQCKSSTGNFKKFDLGDRIGRLSGNNITSGKLIFRSITGNKESIYEF